MQEEPNEYLAISHKITVTLSTEILLDEYAVSVEDLWKEGYTIISDGSYDAVVVAQIRVREFPNRLRELMSIGWADWLDMFDGDTYQAGIRADEVMEDLDFLGVLQDGSLFLFEDLHVHPRFRGQNVGLRLIRHLLVVLNRANGDFAILFANPRNSIYGDNDETCIDNKYALARYYERAGFTVYGEDDAILMEIHMGSVDEGEFADEVSPCEE